MAKKLGKLGGAKAGAEVGLYFGGVYGAIVGGAAGWAGGKLGEYAGDELVEDGRCGIDINVEAPSSSSSLRGDWAYGGIWVVDIPFDLGGLFKPASSTFLSVAEAMPTTSPWESREYVRAGSTLDITADDSLCYRASLDAEFEYEYDCDLYCDFTDPDAVCPAHCRAFEMEFVRIPAGSFVMGSPEYEIGRIDDRYRIGGLWDHLPSERQHSVRISQGFWMGKYEVTQGEWEALMGANPSRFTECGSRCPVEQVSWGDVQEFIRRLNQRQSASGYVYRLPTEAEWEYAARAGSTGARYTYRQWSEFGDYFTVGSNAGPIAWYGGNSYDRTHPVGQKIANEWGLHDMLGNVWEWTADWNGEYRGAETDPQGPDTGSHRMSRGGGWGDNERQVRCAFRVGRSPGARSGDVGFRLVRTE